MNRESLVAWGKAAGFCTAIPLLIFAVKTPECGLFGRVLSSLLLASQVMIPLAAVVLLAVSKTQSSKIRRFRGADFAAPERQQSTAMDDWDAPDRPTDSSGSGSETHEPADGPDLGQRIALLLFVTGLALFGVVLLAQSGVPAGCVNGIV